MKNIFTEFARSIVATIFFAVICCGVYPLMVFGASQLFFPHQANGSLLVDKSGVRGSELLAQNFTGAKYFHPRPSAAGANGYDATSSSGSNLGPTSSNLVANITANIATYRADNNIATNSPIYNMIPADAVTASASGLDPHISPANAELQIPRVAKARGISEEQLRKIVQQNTSGRDLGVFGEPRVNVMTLNFALDQLAQK